MLVHTYFNLTGTIRGDYTLAVRLSTCHASDSVDGAQKEIALSVSSSIARCM